MSTQEQIDAYVDGALSPAERAAFERALAQDPDLRAAVDATLSLQRRAAELPTEATPSADLWPDLEARLAGERSGGGRWMWAIGGVAGLAAVAAALLVAVGVGVWSTGLLDGDAVVADGAGDAWRLPWTRPPTDGAVAAGHAYLRDGDLPGAMAAFEAALAADPDDVEACSGVGYMRLLSGDYTGADEVLDHALQVADAEQRPALLLRRAIVAQRSGDLESMQRHGEASGLGPGLVLAAELYLADAEADAAIPLLRRAAASDDPVVAGTARSYLDDLADVETGRAQLAEATALWALAQYDEAVETAEELLVYLPIDEGTRDSDLLLWAGRAATQGHPGIAGSLIDEMGAAPAGQAWRVEATRALIFVADGDLDGAVALLQALQDGGAPVDGLRDARLTAASLVDDPDSSRLLLAGLGGPEAALVAADATLVTDDSTPLSRFVRGW